MTDLVRNVKWPVGGTPEKPTYETRTVGWRDDAVSDMECPECWGTGKRLRYGRSINCEGGIHDSCSGHQDPSRCGCFCHDDPIPDPQEDP